MSGKSYMEQGALELRDLVRRYEDLTALDHLSLKVKQGEVFGFPGPNGAGKTTSVMMMFGLLKPTCGEVLIDGKPVSPHGSSTARSMVGFCPQENILWNKLTCLEQLIFTAIMYDVPRNAWFYPADFPTYGTFHDQLEPAGADFPLLCNRSADF